ncbi:MAG: hypothetical protein JWN14_3789, partial [Chthonomonadales bacterium]|nr:hypothetical protein [Chthonomonadales bacterium]
PDHVPRLIGLIPSCAQCQCFYKYTLYNCNIFNRPYPTLSITQYGFILRYRYRNTPYEIIVENSDHVSHGIVSLELDGHPVPDHTICLEDDRATHTLRIRLGHNLKPDGSK